MTTHSASPILLPIGIPLGQLVPDACSTSPLVCPAGQQIGAVAVINDISHLDALGHERRRAESLAALETIASGLVHEIRNPLLVIKTFFQLLPSRHHDPDFREKFARSAARELRRIETLLTHFRTLGSVSSEPSEEVDITNPIRHTLDFLQPRFEEGRIRVCLVADGAPRPIVGDMFQLEQLFLNLCLNAIDAMTDAGELTVRVTDPSEAGGTTLMVAVSDTGTGIPDDLLAKLFTPFVTTKRRGRGLGLAICQSIVDAHGARLSARNNVDRPGSTFTLEFPVSGTGPSHTGTTS